MGTLQEVIADRPVRVGEFDSIKDAEAVVQQLRDADFSKQEITVICSDQRKERFFREFEHQKPSGARTPIAVATGSAIGAVVGGLTSAIGLLMTGGAGILATSGIVASAGAIAGGFIGAMMTRGMDKELANYYDQSVEKGKILVSVEIHGEAAEARLLEAEHILASAGTKPLELSEG